MASVISQYLDIVRDNLRLDLVSEKEVIDELQTHLEDEFEEMIIKAFEDEIKRTE